MIARGEASPNSFYNETAESVLAALSAAEKFVSEVRIVSVEDISRVWEEVWEIVAPSRAAQCAIDLALWDLLAQREKISVSELAWGAHPRAIPTFCTIGLSTAEELQQKIAELRGFPMIKIKSNAAADLTPIRSVRAASGAVIAVDANCAWGAHDLTALAAELRALNVAFIEQPFLPENDSRVPRVAGGPPIFADESCVLDADVERVAERFGGFNIKLVKCGGITPAVRMARRGREFGLRTMVGCMLESSILIAAGAAVAQKTDFADLDGAWLLRDDPFRGWAFNRGILSPSAFPGLGVTPRD